jgi:hypothetical protein
MTTGPAPSRLSRRALFGFGASTLLLAGVAATWRLRPMRAAAARRPADAVIPYVDHEGWMVSPAEKRALKAQPRPDGAR